MEWRTGWAGPIRALMKKTLIIAGSLLIFAAVGCWFYGRPAYKRHKEVSFIERARQFKAKGDFRNASLSARQTLAVNPRNLEACRILAEIAETSRSPHAL